MNYSKLWNYWVCRSIVGVFTAPKVEPYDVGPPVDDAPPVWESPLGDYTLSELVGLPPSSWPPPNRPAYLHDLPLYKQVTKWGTTVVAENFRVGSALGEYDPRNNAIIVRVKNWQVFLHEAVHAATNLFAPPGLSRRGIQREAIADLGAASLLMQMGFPELVDFKFLRAHLQACCSSKSLRSVCWRYRVAAVEVLAYIAQNA